MTRLSNKKKRLEAIEEIIKEENIEKQDVLAWELKQRFNISVTQSTLSKDLRELGVKWDKDRQCYLPNDSVARKHSEELLWDLLIKSEGIFFGDSSYAQLIFKCDAIYAAQLATALENHFEAYGVAAIAGMTGTVVLFIPTTQKKMVLSQLNHFFEP